MSSAARFSQRAARAVSVLAFLVPLAAFLIGMRYVGSGDTEPAELLPISVLTRGALDFNQFFPAGRDLPYPYRRIGGRVVSAYPIAAGLLNVPVYAAARALGTDLYARRFQLSMISASLISALSVLFLYLALLKLCDSPRQAFFFAMIYAFGTCLWSVASRGLWQHTPALLFFCAGFWLLLEESDLRVAFAGLMLGLAVVSRPTNLLLAWLAAAWVLWRRRRAFPLFAALALVPAALVTIYSSAYLANPLALGQPFPTGGFTGRFLPGSAGLLASPSRGLFVFSPIFLASIAGAFRLRRAKERELLSFLLVGALLLIALHSFWGMWWGGSAFGYRLILEVAPVFVLLLPAAWNGGIRRMPILRAAFFVLLCFSLYVQFLGAYVYPSSFGENLDVEPSRLWDVRDSELVLCTRKLFHVASGGSRAIAVPAVWWTPEKNEDSVPGWLDASPGGKLIRGPLEISGWAKSSLGVVDVRVVLDDGRVAIPDRVPRPDVARILPELGDTSRAGFRALLVPRDSAPTDHAMAVEFRDPKGSVRRLGPMRFRWSR